MSGVKLSKKWGVNPSLRICPCCGKETGEIIMFGDSYKDKNGKKAEAPMRIAIPGQLCNSCKDIIENKHGVFFIECRDGETGNNPYRTGRLIAIPRERAEEIFKEVNPIQYMHASLFERVFGQALKEQEENKQ